MLWNCDGKVKEIEFRYHKASREYYCSVKGWAYAYENSSTILCTGKWDWFRDGYSLNYSDWNR